ncbi:MAG: surface lipoprotein assembly modifier [Neisseria sp.]|nr:surface lipoprotein assembly modifier [Neisseria sp.]
MKFSRWMCMGLVLLPLAAEAHGEVRSRLMQNAPETEDAERRLDKVLPQAAPQQTPIAEPFLPAGAAQEEEWTDAADVPPDRLEPWLNRSLNERRYDRAAALLPRYRELPDADKVLADFAQGAIWREEGRHKEAVALYRKLLDGRPELQTVRLDLAAMLFEDRQDRDSGKLFDEAEQMGLPEDVLPRIEQYREALAGRGSWQFSLGGGYVQDDNLNNVSDSKTIRLPQFGNLPFEKDEAYLPKSGRGAEYNISASRDISLTGNHYLALGASADGVLYWDNHDYDDVTFRLEAGYRNKSLKQDWSLVPFAEHRRTANERYYIRSGFDAAYSRWLSNRWRVSANGALAWKNYTGERTARDAAANVGVTYLAGSSAYLFGGVNYGRDKMHNRPESSSVRTGAYAGWGQSWPWHFGSRAVLSRYNERYDGEHYIFRDRRRKDKVLGTTLSLWNDKLSFWQITPRLNWRYTKVNSNLPDLHSYGKHKLFFSFEKSF